jgi:predicted RNA binding protein YcfA (HicA-like mRNA interferase family)
LPKLRKVSGEKVVKILCNNFEFKVTGRKGSHVRLTKITQKGKVGTVVPMHKELKIGTLRGVLKLAKVDVDEFSKYL